MKTEKAIWKKEKRYIKTEKPISFQLSVKDDKYNIIDDVKKNIYLK